MKKLTAIFCLIAALSIKAQELGWYPGEMYLATSNVTPPTQTLTFTIEAQGTAWAGSDTPISYWISTEYSTSSFTPQANNEWPPSYWRGWDFVTSITNNPPYTIPIYGYGLYKMTTNNSNEFFYLDFRDDRYGYYQSPINGHWIDLWIRYDASTQKFSYSSSGSAYESFINISKGEYIPIWEMKQKGQPQTSLFPNYWENCLVAITQKNPSTGVFEPFIVWGPYPGLQPIGYKIYWRLGETGSFTLLQTVNASTFSFRHENLQVGQGRQAYYKVKAYYGPDEESDFTNIASINTSGWYYGYKWSLEENNLNMPYKLEQNYPNPFNPSTKIKFTLPKSDFVSIKIYDLLGKEVRTLVSSFMEAGNHTVKFNAEELPSGIYLYKIESDKFVETRKMNYIK
jgi:hypothetical protein